MMVHDISRSKLLGIWCFAVVALGAFAIAAGAELTAGNSGWWLATGLVPAAIMLLIWRGPPPLTVAELLHSVNASQTQGRQ